MEQSSLTIKEKFIKKLAELSEELFQGKYIPGCEVRALEMGTE